MKAVQRKAQNNLQSTLQNTLQNNLQNILQNTLQNTLQKIIYCYLRTGLYAPDRGKDYRFGLGLRVIQIMSRGSERGRAYGPGLGSK